jgi:uncharacterized cupredoxin-like copper-binding protein
MRHAPRRFRRDVRRRLAAVTFAAGLALLALACEAGPPPITPTPHAGTADSPREVNLIAKDYSFQPATLELIRGETVLLHVINGGLEVHEAVIGDGPVQDAWEAAEAATVGAPPGPTPVVSVPPEVSGLRIVVRSGERVDIRWTVPIDAGSAAGQGDWIVGCHIPGHLAAGMWIPIHWITEPAS